MIEASIVIASRDRQHLLDRVLNALTFQQDARFEVIVVSNTSPDVAFKDHIKFIHFDEANLSRARNLGVMSAHGPIIAFIDDDAVPEPDWLIRLLVGFKNKKTGLAGGSVLGRNGISLQWGARRVDGFGHEAALNLKGAEYFSANTTNPIKLQGTNFAVKKTLWAQLGGFDERFDYYLDETDFIFRANQNGAQTYFDPDAVVQHGFAENATRKGNRAQKSLRPIARSYAGFVSTHLDTDQGKQALSVFYHAQRARLFRQLNDGLLEPRDIKPLLEDLEAGLREARSSEFPEITVKKTKPLLFPTKRGAPKTYSGWRYGRTIKGLKVSKPDQPTMLISYGLGLRNHTRGFSKNGTWVLSGGCFGKLRRDHPRLNFLQKKTLKNAISDLPKFWKTAPKK